MSFLNILVDIAQPNDANLSILGLVLISIAAALFLVAIIVRAFRHRQACRVLLFVGSLFLVGFNSLFFVGVPSFNTWMIQDYAQVILFASSLLLAIHFLVMSIRKS